MPEWEEIDEAELLEPKVEISRDEMAVIDQVGYNDSGFVYGYIEYPKEFCGIGTPGGCDSKSESRHDLSFRKVGSWWVHTACLRPTKKWWDATFRDFVTVTDASQLPWNQNSNDSGSR